MTEQITFNVDADYIRDMAAVEAYERKRQREHDVDPEEIAEWEAQDAIDSCGDFPEDDQEYDEWE